MCTRFGRIEGIEEGLGTAGARNLLIGVGRAKSLDGFERRAHTVIEAVPICVDLYINVGWQTARKRLDEVRKRFLTALLFIDLNRT
jgi:hypothetical protein